MANIGGLSSSTSSSLGSLRGYGGLSSGLDRDSLIEGMTYATTSKIEKQQQKKTLLQWEQTAIRNITDKLTSFADKYTSTYSSSTNLFSSSFWGRNNITALGANSKYVSVSGSATTADTLEITRIKQLAKKAQLTSSDRVSDNTLKTGEIDAQKYQNVENLEGKTLKINYGDKNYTITLPSGTYKDENGTEKEYKYDTLDDVVTSMNKAFENFDVSSGKKLSEVLEVRRDGDKIVFEDKEKAGNILKLTGGTAVDYLGFKADPADEFKELDITNGSVSSVRDITNDDLITEIYFKDRIAGKSLVFTYNGTSKTIKMPSQEELDQMWAGGNPQQFMENLAAKMQDQLDDAFGKGRITAVFSGQDGKGGFEFKTTTPDGKEDKSSVLTLSSSDSGMMGENGAFNTAYGESNRVNLSASILESGLGIKDDMFDADGKFKFKINGKEITISKEDTMSDIMKRINEETDVNITYQSAADKFVITSKNEGASGTIQFEADNEEALKKLFGQNILDEAKGQDAVLSVKYAGSDEEIEIVRDSNSFKVDGMTITVKGTFGYKKDENGELIEDVNGELIEDDTAESVTFDAQVDEDKITETIKKMVEEFNEIIELVNQEAKTKPDRDYSPLTSSQKEELSESEIKAWEEKAKEGLLFNDNDIKGLSNGLRFILGSGDKQTLEKMGITSSSSASDNGKLTFDENTFRAALASDPEGVQKMFTKVQEKDADGNITQTNGIAQNLKEVLDKYAKTIGEPKGVLITRAGSTKSPASITTNSLYKQIQEIDERIAQLQDKLTMEQDRYIKQFTSLETLISQMNSQSGMLSQFGGGF